MSIQKRSNGRWRARYRDDAGHEHAKHFDRERDAKQWLAQMSSDLLTRRYVDPKLGKRTLASYYAEWSQRQIWASGTRTAMNLAMRGCTFADIPMSGLRNSHVESWVKSMSSAGLAPGTIKTRFNNVRSVVRGAIRDKSMHDDPMDGVTLPRLRRAEHAMTIPQPEQVGQILESAEYWFRPMVALYAYAGLRLGEGAAVQVSDFDFLRRTLTVQRQVQRAPGGLVEITLPKYGSERVVALPDELLELISRHITDTGVTGREEWLFGQGVPPNQNKVGNWWRKTLEHAGVGHWRLHDLRHFYASGLIAAGCDVVTVQRALGHASATTTLRTYSHLWPDAEDRTRAAAAKLMALSAGNATDLAGAESLRRRV